jgi:hypothetical protein
MNEKNEVILEGRLNGYLPHAVYHAGDQLRVEVEVLHTNPYTQARHRFRVEARGGTAKALFDEYSANRFIGITGRLKSAANGSTKIIVQNFAMLDQIDFAMDTDYADRKARFMQNVNERHEARKQARAAEASAIADAQDNSDDEDEDEDEESDSNS